MFAITEAEWTSERAIASLVAATNGSGIHALVAVIVPTIAEKRFIQDFQGVLNCTRPCSFFLIEWRCGGHNKVNSCYVRSKEH